MEALFSLLSSDNLGNTQTSPVFTECKSPFYYSCSKPCTFFLIFLFLLPTCINEVVHIGRKLHTAYTCYFRIRIPRRTWNKTSLTCFSLNPSPFSNGCQIGFSFSFCNRHINFVDAAVHLYHVLFLTIASTFHHLHFSEVLTGSSHFPEHKEREIHAMGNFTDMERHCATGA